MSKLIVFATMMEAKETLKMLDAQELSENRYRIPDGEILISGIGLLNTCLSLAPLASSFDEIWNLGICGALQDHSLGEILEVKSVRRYIAFPLVIEEYSRSFSSALFPSLQLQEEGTTLLSCDFPIHQETLKKELAIEHGLIDMEGYAVALAAKGKKIRMWKYISDFAKAGGPKMIQEQLRSASKALAEQINMVYTSSYVRAL